MEDTDVQEESDTEYAFHGDDGDGDGRPGPGSSGAADGDGAWGGGQSKRRSRLGERVVRVMAQCQACLYDVAVVPCEVGLAAKGCSFPPRSWRPFAPSASVGSGMMGVHSIPWRFRGEANA